MSAPVPITALDVHTHLVDKVRCNLLHIIVREVKLLSGLLRMLEECSSCGCHCGEWIGGFAGSAVVDVRRGLEGRRALDRGTGPYKCSDSKGLDKLRRQ